MSIFKNFEWSLKNILKIIGVVFAGAVVLAIAASLFSFSIRTIFNSGYNRSYDQAMSYGKGGAFDALEEASFAPSMMNSRMVVPTPEFSTGTDAEDFEIKTFNASVRTRKLEKTCGIISDLKVREDVIFENANENENGCNYRFKVAKEKEAEILAIVESLKPEDLNTNIHTIKGSVDATDKQLEILENKLASVEETLESAQDQYDELTELATRKQDVESLATIIDSKLNLIERLTNQRISIKEQIDRYKNNKEEQLDGLEFSFFNVSIFEDLIWDWKQIKDEWRWQIKELVNNFNEVVQSVTVGLVSFLMRVFQAAVYFFLALFILKGAWMGTKRVWKYSPSKKRK